MERSNIVYAAIGVVVLIGLVLGVRSSVGAAGAAADYVADAADKGRPASASRSSRSPAR